MAAIATLNLPDEEYRWTAEQFVRAWEDGIFGDDEVELVNGRIFPVTPIGFWHGQTTLRLARQFYDSKVILTTESLPVGPDSLLDPDLWVLRKGAQPVARLGERLNVYDPADVLLVVEVSDTTLSKDLHDKRDIYGQAGFEHYWIVTESGVYRHWDRDTSGNYQRREFTSEGPLDLPYSEVRVWVEDLIGSMTKDADPR